MIQQPYNRVDLLLISFLFLNLEFQ